MRTRCSCSDCSERRVTRHRPVPIIVLDINVLACRSARRPHASLARPTLERIVAALPDTTIADLTGERPPGPPEWTLAASPYARLVQLIGSTARPPADNALTGGRLAPRIPVPATLLPEVPGLFAITVEGPGADLLYPPGSVLVARPLSGDASDLPDGTLVVLRCRRDGRNRLEIREVERHDGRPWLWLRSTHPELQQPLPAPRPISGTVHTQGGETVTVIGIIVASWQRERHTTEGENA